MRIMKLGLLVSYLLVFCIAGASESLLPKPSSSALPMYPEQARKARVAGSVKLWFMLDAKGVVTQAGVISGNPLLREAAARTVKSWTFQPAVLRPNVHIETEFIYALKVQSKEGEPMLTVSIADYRRVEVTCELYVEAIE